MCTLQWFEGFYIWRSLLLPPASPLLCLGTSFVAPAAKLLSSGSGAGLCSCRYFLLLVGLVAACTGLLCLGLPASLYKRFAVLCCSRCTQGSMTASRHNSITAVSTQCFLLSDHQSLIVSKANDCWSWIAVNPQFTRYHWRWLLFYGSTV